MLETRYMTAVDGTAVFVRSWTIENPIGNVQVVHGMNEHGGRYDEFAVFLNTHGFNVYATDHRGHGATAGSVERIGYIKEVGFATMVSDEYQLLCEIKQAGDKELPHFLLGHSMGSFVTQRFIQLYGYELAGTILMGSCGYNSIVRIGRYAAILAEKVKKDAPSLLLEKLVFKGYNHRTEKRTTYDWLAADPTVVDTFIADPYCAHIFPPSFYHHFLQWLQDIFIPSEVAKIPKDLPLLLVAGAEDPVGLYGKGMEDLEKQYQKHGTKDLQLILYPESRHEILNDIEKEQVFSDILRWLQEHVL